MCIVLKSILFISMERSCPWGAGFPQLDQEFLAFYVTKIDYIIHRGSPLVPIIPQTNAVHNVTSYSPHRQFNKILQTKWSHYFKFFPPKLSYFLASLSRVSDKPRHCHPYMFYKENFK